jgi:hypothetical protein
MTAWADNVVDPKYSGAGNQLTLLNAIVTVTVTGLPVAALLGGFGVQATSFDKPVGILEAIK